MDRLRTIQVFIQVVEQNSFTRAAETLGMPKSSVSAAVQALEDRLRTRLLHRTTRRMHLTADGEAYLEWCRRVLEDIQGTEARFRQRAARPSGRLRVDIPSRIARLVVVPRLPDFFRRYPGIHLEFGANDQPLDLVQEGVDCAVRVGELPDTQHSVHPLGELNVINCASPAYLARHGTPETLPDLENHWKIEYTPSTLAAGEPWECLEGDVARYVSVRSRMTVNSAESYVAACLAGLGMIQVPAYDAMGHIESGELVEVLSHLRPKPMPLSVILPSARSSTVRVKAFVDWVVPVLKAYTNVGVV